MIPKVAKKRKGKHEESLKAADDKKFKLCTFINYRCKIIISKKNKNKKNKNCGAYPIRVLKTI